MFHLPHNSVSTVTVTSSVFQMKESLQGVDSPSRLFEPGYKPKCNFMLDDILKHLQTPEKEAQEARKSIGEKVFPFLIPCELYYENYTVKFFLHLKLFILHQC